ncbi:MAG TPA: hypothetical protein VHV30_14590 [Polyangiaceae bacterium]|nr:hypothetical protein [Polyangiaceae bacterium]
MSLVPGIESRSLASACALAIAFAALASSGCADIWGFEDPIPLRDAGEQTSDGAAACTCVGSAPDGWQGPYELSETAGAAPAPDAAPCGAAFPASVFTGHTTSGTPAASCDCTCDVTCAPPVATVFSDTGCTRSCGTASVGTLCSPLAPPTCPQNGSGGPGKGNAASVSFAAAANPCAARPTADASAPPWTGSAALCMATGIGARACAAGEVCVPAADVGFEAGAYCVMRAGPASCPPGYPVSRGPYYAGATDSRVCSCTCDSPPGVTCALDVTTFDDATCGAARDHVVTAGACASAAAAAVAVVLPAAGTCMAHGTPSGAFEPTGETTICCTQ